MNVLLILAALTTITASNTYYYENCGECNGLSCVVSVQMNGTYLKSQFYDLLCICGEDHCGTHCQRSWISKSDMISCLAHGFCKYNNDEGLAANIFFVMMFVFMAIFIVLTTIWSVNKYAAMRRQTYEAIEMIVGPESPDSRMSFLALGSVVAFIVSVVFSVLFAVLYTVYKDKITGSSNTKFCLL